MGNLARIFVEGATVKESAKHALASGVPHEVDMLEEGIVEAIEAKEAQSVEERMPAQILPFRSQSSVLEDRQEGRPLSQVVLPNSLANKVIKVYSVKKTPMPSSPDRATTSSAPILPRHPQAMPSVHLYNRYAPAQRGQKRNVFGSNGGTGR